VVNAECITHGAAPLLLLRDGQAIAWGDFLKEKTA